MRDHCRYRLCEAADRLFVSDQHSFFNLYRHGFVRLAVAIPRVQVADPLFNVAQTIALLR